MDFIFSICRAEAVEIPYQILACDVNRMDGKRNESMYGSFSRITMRFRNQMAHCFANIF